MVARKRKCNDTENVHHQYDIIDLSRYVVCSEMSKILPITIMKAFSNQLAAHAFCVGRLCVCEHNTVRQLN